MSVRQPPSRKTSKRAPSDRGDATLQSILENAEVLFAETGLTGTRLESIAQAVGITRASVLHYFSGKQDIYDHIQSDIHQKIQSRFEEQLTNSLPARERILLLLDTLLNFMVSRPTAARIIQRNSIDRPTDKDNPLKFSHNIVAAFEATMLEGQRNGQFVPSNPVFALNILGGGILSYVCNADLLGPGKSYVPSDPTGLADYRKMLHDVALVILFGSASSA